MIITALKMGSESSRVVKMCMNPENMPITKWSRTASNFIELIPTRQFNKYVGKFFWSWILQDCIKVQEKKNKVVVLCSCPLQNMKLRTLTSQLCSMKSTMHMQSCCFANWNLLFLFTFLLPSPYSLLMLPNNLTVHYSSLGVKVFSVICIKSD